MIANVETIGQPYNARFKMLRPVIEKLCRLCGIEVDFVPYGQAGEVIHGKIECRACSRTFHARLSMCNEVAVYCTHCMHSHLVFTDGKTAHTIVTLPVTEGQ